MLEVEDLVWEAIGERNADAWQALAKCTQPELELFATASVV
jgi:hypothetical protein